MSQNSPPSSPPIPRWRRSLAIAILWAGLAWMAYEDVYRSISNWNHFPPIVLGMCLTWLVVDGVRVLFAFAIERTFHWPKGWGLAMLVISILGAAITLAMSLTDPSRFGFAGHDQTVIDLFVGAGCAMFRYFDRIRFSHQSSTP